MARYSEKDPGKDKKAPSPTYAAPAKNPSGEGYANALKAEDPGGSCSLIVIVLNEATSELIPNARVTVSSEELNQTQILLTNEKGRVHVPDLSPGDYVVEVTHNDYRAEPKRKQVPLVEGEYSRLHFELEPEQGILNFLAFYDAEGSGDPKGQAPIKHLHFDVLLGNEVVGHGVTDENGTACLPVHYTGWVAIRTVGGVKLDGMHLVPADGYQQLAELKSGRQTTVSWAYVSGSSGLIVETVLESGGRVIPLPGVGLALRGKGAGDLVRNLVTSGRKELIGDLLPGNYTLDITMPPPHHGSAIELEDPNWQGASVVVGSSYPTEPLVLRFRQALGQVTGSIRREDGRAAWGDIELVLKSLAGEEMYTARTGEDGDFQFDGVHPGTYLMELAGSKIVHGQDHWVPTSQVAQKIHVNSGARFNANAFVLERDKHTLTIRTFDSDGHPLPFAPVDVLTENGNLIRTYSTDEAGLRTVDVGKAGIYQVVFRDNGEVRHMVQVSSETIVDMQKQPGGNKYIKGSHSGPTETTIDIPYPLITESASMGGSSWGSAPSSSADLGQTVQEALRSVLNWRSAGFNGDAKGFVAALNQSFTITQTQGHTELTWTPRSYAAVQSGLGALTGAQASIYTRAKVALDQITPLLAGLYPLLSDADPQNVEAIRAIVRSGVTELINEFGIEGGPRVPRVDDLFRQLVGTAVQTDPENVGGQLKQLSDYFGLLRVQVNTIDEEQNLTNFLIIVDYLLGLQQSWLTQRNSFTRGTNSKPFLGTQLVLVERSLAVVAESVQEVYMTLDSVFVGKEERQVVELTFPPYQAGEDGSSLFVSELLGWIDQVASNEGPQLIKDGGKQGVISFKDTISRLAFLASQALLSPQAVTATGPNLPKGYRTARVQNALAELAAHLQETSNLINPFH